MSFTGGQKSRIRAFSFLKSTALTVLFSYLFYRSRAVIWLLFPLNVYMAVRFEKKEQEKREQELCRQFRDGIASLAASLRAGHSAENAFRDAAGELELLYGREERMPKEFKRIVSRTEMNVPLEQAVAEMALRCGIADIETFSEVFSAARRTGGELGKMILDTIQTISGRMEVREEIYTMLRGRQYEQAVMKAVPVFLLVYMDISSPGYFSVLYDTLLGRGIMTICFILYLAAWFLADKIADIRV